MKTTLLTTVILSMFFLFSCSKDADELTGFVTVEGKEAERPSIKLTNARAAKTKVVSEPMLTVSQGSTIVIDNEPLSEVGTVELVVGQYKALLQTFEQDGIYKGNVAANGESNFTVSAGNLSEVTVVMYNISMYVEVQLQNLPGATIWVGPKGFEPSNDYLYPGFPVTVYAEDEFDIVVEYEGETKRYSAPASLGGDYVVTIVKNDDEEPEVGNAMFDVVYENYGPTSATFEW